MLARKCLELADDLCMMTQREVGVDALLERRPRLLTPLCILLGLAGLWGLRLVLYGSPLGIL